MVLLVLQMEQTVLKVALQHLVHFQVQVEVMVKDNQVLLQDQVVQEVVEEILHQQAVVVILLQLVHLKVIMVVLVHQEVVHIKKPVAVAVELLL